MAGFYELPIDLLEIIVSKLSATELVIMSSASKEMSKAVSRCGMWEELSKHKWPICCFSSPFTPAGLHYSTYQEMFCKRMAMESSFADKVDDLHIVTDAARIKLANVRTSTAATSHLSPVTLRSRQSIDVLVSQAIQLAGSLEAVIAKRPQLQGSREYKVVQQDVAWWLDEQSQALLQHARKSADLVDGGHIGRRQHSSGVQHMLSFDLRGLVHQSVLDVFSRERFA